MENGTIKKKAAPRRKAPARPKSLYSQDELKEIFRRFSIQRPEPKGELEHVNPFTLVVAVALSAQATDAGVNKATRALFKVADTPEKMLALGEEKVRDHIKTIGLYRNKAKNVIALSREGWRKDIGFRAFKIDSSNMVDVYYTPDALEQGQLEFFIDNIKPDRTAEDLLFQVMLDWGVDLALPIEKKTLGGKEVFFVDTDALAACFDGDGGIDDALIKELAKTKPLRAVFRDKGFKDDAAKINAEQIFKQLSPGTDVKTL